MEKKRIIVKRPGVPLEIIEVEAKYRCDLKPLIANADLIETTEMIPAAPHISPIFICVDEEGHPKHLPTNFYIPTTSISFPVQVIVGVAVFTRLMPFEPWIDDYDVQLDNLTDDDISLVKKYLNETNQNLFECEFKRRYPTMESYLAPVVISF